MSGFLKCFKPKMILIPLSLTIYSNIHKKKTFMADDILRIKLPDIQTLKDQEIQEIKYGSKINESF